ncbi:MAG: hypothetical protein ACRENF_01355, partial [Thermodesulfobacteriota bacterium]
LVESCISFCVFVLRKGCISLPEPTQPIPNKYIKELHSNYTMEDSNGSLRAVSNDPRERLLALINDVVIAAVEVVHEEGNYSGRLTERLSPSAQGGLLG